MILLGILITFSLKASAAVWQAENQWSEAWEQAYSEWIQTTWNETSLMAPNTAYHGLKVDCADAVYSARAIFSFENKLPFAIKDPTGGSNVISNEMGRWDGLSNRDRIRGFLQFINGIVATSTLPNDTYPVRIDRSQVRPGTILLVDKTNHHSWTVKTINDHGIPTFIYSSRPAKSKLSLKVGMPNTSYVFPRGIRAEFHAGFRNFKKPHELRLPLSQISGYSEQQYSVPAKEWRARAQDNLAMVRESLAQKLERTLMAACRAAQERVDIVNTGLQFLKTYPKKCLDPQSYDDHSTPSRDLRMKQDFEDLVDTFHQVVKHGEQGTVPANIYAAAAEIVFFEDQNELRSSGWCAVKFAEGEEIALGELRRRITKDMLSHNPHDPVEYRWGKKSGHSERARQCPEY